VSEEVLRVQPGRRVELILTHVDDEEETLTLDIVADSAADFERGLLGAGTPLARSIHKRRAGDAIDYRVGDLKRVTIVSVQRSPRDIESDAAERRQEIIDRAVSESDRTNALNFASSFSSKWGGYEPEGIEDWDDDEK
jgi:hypothetical protein